MIIKVGLLALALLLGACGDGNSSALPDLSVLPNPSTDLSMPDIATGYSCLASSDCPGVQACCVQFVGSAPLPAECSTATTRDKQCPNGPNICRVDGDCPNQSPRCCFAIVPGIPPAAGTCLSPTCN